MKKALLALCLAVFLTGCHLPHLKFPHLPQRTPVVDTRTSLEKQQAATHRIGLRSVINEFDDLGPDAHCSGTTVSPVAILTAAHCVTNTNEVYLDKEEYPTFIVAELPDGHDHIIYIVNRTFTDYTPVIERALIPGEPVHLWGNPGHAENVYREGYFKHNGFEKELPGLLFDFFVLPVYGGDSGSGIFDANGNVVDVSSLGSTSAEELSLPLAFSATQLKAAGVEYKIIEREPDIYFTF